MTYSEMSIIDLTRPVQAEIDDLLDRIGPLHHDDGKAINGEQALFRLRCAVAYSAVHSGDFDRGHASAGQIAIESAATEAINGIMQRAGERLPGDFVQQVNQIADLAVDRLQA